MLNLNVTPISTISDSLTFILPNFKTFPSLEVVDRVSETQLQVGGDYNFLIWRLKGKFYWRTDATSQTF